MNAGAAPKGAAVEPHPEPHPEPRPAAHLAWLDQPVEQIMLRDPVTVEVTDSLRVVQARMNGTGAGHLPVLDGGRPVGLVTARDLARSMPVPLTVLRRDEIERLLGVPVAQIMSAPVITVPAGETVGVAVSRMVESGIGAVVVVSRGDGKLAGLVTRSIIVSLVACSA